MKFLVDTCVVSELIKKVPDKRIIEWITSVSEDSLFLSVLTIGEIKKGIAQLQESKKKNDLIDWLSQLESRFSGRTINIDNKVVETWGHITGTLESKGITLPSIDSLIACTAISNGLIVVTRNVKDMKPTGVEILNPWK